MYIVILNHLWGTEINSFLCLSVYYFFFIFQSTRNAIWYFTRLFQSTIVLTNDWNYHMKFVERLLKVTQGDWLINSNYFHKAIITFTEKLFNFNGGDEAKKNGWLREICQMGWHQFKEMLWILAHATLMTFTPQGNLLSWPQFLYFTDLILYYVQIYLQIKIGIISECLLMTTQQSPGTHSTKFSDRMTEWTIFLIVPLNRWR